MISEVTPEIDSRLMQAANRLAASWRQLATTLELHAPVLVSTRHRFVAHSLDVITQCSVVDTVYREAFNYQLQELRTTQSMNIKEHSDHWGSTHTYAIALSQRLAVSYKAMSFFVRALQDATYAVLLELDGQKSGQHSSMSDSFKRCNHIAQCLRSGLPAYENWFQEHREIRNQIKNGQATGLSFTKSESNTELTVTLYSVQDDPPLADISNQLTIGHIVQAVEMSAELMEWVDKRSKEKFQPIRDRA